MSTQLDTKVISKLAEILDKSNLTELKYEEEGFKVCLTRNATISTSAPVYAQAPVVAASIPAVSTPVSAPATEAPSLDEDYSKSSNAVKSPMVGVVYLSADPNSPNYVKVGDSVNEGDTVCLIEAMKTFNPVKAHKAGKVTKILVSGGDPVEYGEPLIIIE